MLSLESLKLEWRFEHAPRVIATSSDAGRGEKMTVSWSGFDERPDMAPAVQVEDAPAVRASDVAALGVALPSSVARCKEAGYLEEAARLCRDLLERDPASPLAPRLRLEWYRLARLAGEYCMPLDKAVAELAAAGANVTAEDVRALVAKGRIDVRFIAGKPYTLFYFLDTLRIYAAEVPGLASADAADGDMLAPRRAMREEMRRAGHAARDITIRAAIEVNDVEPGDDVRIWLPVASDAPQQSHIEVLEASPEGRLAASDAPARTMFWQFSGPGSRSVTFRYRIDAPYTDLWTSEGIAEARGRTQVTACEPPTESDYTEEVPHIAFTPLVREVARAVRAAARDDSPLELARAAYDYVTTHVSYRYQPSYIQLEVIPDYCLATGYGDCGVMALTFITLCRCLGVAARWQSGLYAAPDCISPHDWAMFYTPETGWLWADCSFGIGAHREHDEELRRFYFGNLDPWRTVFNRAFAAPLEPSEEAIRRDPFDNQVGEAFVNGHSLDEDEFSYTVELIDIAEVPSA